MAILKTLDGGERFLTPFFPGATKVEAGRLGTLQIVNGSEVLLGAPFIYNKDNIDAFDF